MCAEIFIVLSDFQARVASILIKDRIESSKLVLVAPKFLKERYFAKAQVQYIPVPYSPSSQGVFGVFCRAFNEKKTLKALLSEVESFDRLKIYAPHFEGFLSNWLFCRFSTRDEVSFNLIQDGVLSYYRCRPNNLKMSTKKIMSAILRERFKSRIDEITMIASEKIEKNFVFFGVEHTLIPNKACSIDPLKKRKVVNGSGAIIIGQEPIVQKMGIDSYQSIVSSMVEAAYERSQDVSYVFHPRSDQKLKAMIKPILERSRVKVISLNSSVEDYVLENGDIRFVFAHSSSALFLIKILVEDGVECFSFAQERDESSRKINSALKAAGVHFL